MLLENQQTNIELMMVQQANRVCFDVFFEMNQHSSMYASHGKKETASLPSPALLVS